jgi:hypothetical protein
MSRKALTPLVLPADPTAALEAVTKQYCDARTGASAGNALGVIATAVRVTQPVVSAAPVAAAGVPLHTPVTVTFLTGRRYRISFQIHAAWISAGTSGSIQFRVNDAANAIVGDSDMWVLANGSALTAPYAGGFFETYLNGDGTTKTIRGVVCGQTASTTGSTYAQQLLVEDIGPNATPALPIPATDPPWTAMTLSGTWVNFATFGAAAAYRRVGDIVTVRGFVKNATSLAGASAIAILPVGFRAAYTQIFPAMGTVGGGTLDVAYRVDARSDGELRWQGPVGVVNNLSLDAIQFSTTL